MLAPSLIANGIPVQQRIQASCALRCGGAALLEEAVEACSSVLEGGGGPQAAQALFRRAIPAAAAGGGSRLAAADLLQAARCDLQEAGMLEPRNGRFAAALAQ
ncbi:unnamed protein product, partial [Prorocentrum cordatum]